MMLIVVLYLLIQINDVTGECGDPQAVEYASHDGMGSPYAENTVIQFTCNRGYSRNGYPKFTCLNNNWATPPGPTLQCTPKTCGSPGEVSNGRRIGHVFEVAKRVEFICNTGYRLDGNRYRTCLADGQWTGRAPTCEILECPSLRTPTHGEKRGTDLTYGSSVTFTCDSGYSIVGSVRRECEADDTSTAFWSGELTSCREIDCGLYVDVPFGTIDYTGTGDRKTKYGAVVTIRCFPNATFSSGDEYVISYCVDPGNWNPVAPSCLAKCLVPDIPHGRVLQGNSDVVILLGNNILHGDQVRYICHDGYEADQETGECDKGQLSPLPTCTGSRCPLDVFKEVQVYTDGCSATGNTVKHDCSVLVTCKDMDVPEHNATCSLGRWTGVTCKIISPTPQPPSDSFPGYGIALLVLGAIAAIAGTILGVILCKKKKKSNLDTCKQSVAVFTTAAADQSSGDRMNGKDSEIILRSANNRKPNAQSQQGHPENEKLTPSPV